MKDDQIAYNKVIYRAKIYDLDELGITNKKEDYFFNKYHYGQYAAIFDKN